MAFRAMSALARPATVAIDVGANIGVFTYLLSRLVGPSGRVHAIEPDPVSVARLKRMQRALHNVTVHPIAASDQNGSATLHVPLLQSKRIGALASLSRPREGAAAEYDDVSIQVEPLDSILSAADGVVEFIKIDVEGHEMGVLRGAEATLRRSLPSMLIEIEQRHSQVPIKSTFAHLMGLGYMGYGVGARGLTPIEAFDLQRDQLAFVGAGFLPAGMPAEYVHDFVFVRPDVDVRPLISIT